MFSQGPADTPDPRCSDPSSCSVRSVFRDAATAGCFHRHLEVGRCVGNYARDAGVVAAAERTDGSGPDPGGHHTAGGRSDR